MSGAFAVPDWDAGAAPSTLFQFNKNKLKAKNKAKTNSDSKAPQPKPKPSAAPSIATTTTTPGQFVRMLGAANANQSPAKKRKHVAATPDKASSAGKKGDAKKRKLDEASSTKRTVSQKSKVAQPKVRAAHDKYAHMKPNADLGSVTKKKAAPFNKPKPEKFAKKEVKPVEVKKPAKKQVKVRPAKKVVLADEESDSELAAEVNQFRKQLLKGFTGPKESSGNDEVSFSDNDDLDLSDSDDERAKPKKAKPFEDKKDAKKAATKKQVAADADERDAKKVATKKPQRKHADSDEHEEEEEDDAPEPAADNSFRDKLIGNLKGSRFRYLNEILYSTEGSNGVKLFKEDRAAFTAYHDGYRQQVEQWPLNPLDRIIKSIKKLPKTLVIADFGCGEGRLAKAVPQKTYSLDLVAQRHEIIACDMAQTPLETNSIDVAVYCLSLMGTNLRDFVLEANRVLKTGGLLKIAEVESRFADVRQFVEHIKACGFQHVNTDSSSKFFVFINFKKVRNVEKTNKQVPAFSLKPCLYKKR